MLTPEQNLEFPLWTALAKAIIARGAIDYITSLMILNGEKVPNIANNVEIIAHPEKIRDGCETFFFSGWFRILSADSGLDGMRLATAIEEDWKNMYEYAKHAKSGRPIETISAFEESKKEKERRKARERYWRKKARLAEERSSAEKI